MKLIIDIPEQMYLNAKTDTLCGAGILISAIKNGIPYETVTEFADRCRECGAKYGKLLKQKSCEDVISRQEVDTLVDELARAISDERCCISRGRSTATIMQDILELPPVKPQEPKTGHWIQTNEFFINQDGQFIYNFICSECKSLSYFRKSNKKAIGANVCPNCKAKMVELRKRSEKE